MRLVWRDPPLLVLLIAILLDLPVRRVEAGAAHKRASWAARKLARLIERRDGLSRRAS